MDLIDLTLGPCRFALRFWTDNPHCYFLAVAFLVFHTYFQRGSEPQTLMPALHSLALFACFAFIAFLHSQACGFFAVPWILSPPTLLPGHAAYTLDAVTEALRSVPLG
jgi:hypothetical protein